MRQQVIGPRGGISTEEVSCYTCISATTCHLTRFKDLGCADWVSEDGRYRASDCPRIEGLSNEEFDALTPSEKETAEGIDELCGMPDPFDDEDLCSCGDPDCTAMFDDPANIADHHPAD